MANWSLGCMKLDRPPDPAAVREPADAPLLVPPAAPSSPARMPRAPTSAPIRAPPAVRPMPLPANASMAKEVRCPAHVAPDVPLPQPTASLAAPQAALSLL